MDSPPANVDDGPAPYWKCVVAAVPQLLIGLQFLLAHWNIQFFGVSRYDLTDALAVEAIALYAALVFGMLWIFLSSSPTLRTARNAQIVLLFAACAGAAYSMGTAEALQFFAMTIITYLGLFMSWKHPSLLLQAISRWAVAYASLALSTSMYDTPDQILKWGGDERALDAGTLYFFLIAAVELSGLHLQIIPRHRVVILTNVYGFFGKSYP